MIEIKKNFSAFLRENKLYNYFFKTYLILLIWYILYYFLFNYPVLIKAHDPVYFFDYSNFLAVFYSLSTVLFIGLIIFPIFYFISINSDSKVLTQSNSGLKPYFILNKDNSNSNELIRSEEVYSEKEIYVLSFNSFLDKFFYVFNNIYSIIYLIFFLNIYFRFNSNSTDYYVYIYLIVTFFLIYIPVLISLKFKVKFLEKNLVVFTSYLGALNNNQNMKYSYYTNSSKISKYSYFSYKQVDSFRFKNNNLFLLLKEGEEIKIKSLSQIEISRCRDLLLSKGIIERRV